MGTSFQAIVFCRVCGRSVGDVDEGELIHLLSENPDGPICFDCELPQSMRIYDNYFGLADGGTVRIDNVVFDVGGEKLLSVNDSLTRAHDARARPCLSSVTYLNRTEHNESVFLNGAEARICPECHGDSISWGEDWGVNCHSCNGQGLIVSAIFLPLWLISGVRENA